MNQLKPLVTINCTTYNQEPYIRQCIEGFLMQKTNFPFEVLIHDDASTDKTAEIIREYEVKYPDIIKPIFQTENQYSKKVRISSIFQYPRAKGKYIALCEGDDYWIDSLKLQKQVTLLEENEEYGLIHTNFYRFFQNKKKLRNRLKEYIPNEQVTDYLLEKNFISTPTVVFKKDLLNHVDWKEINDLKLKLMDWPLWLIFSRYCKFKYIPEVTTVYRILENSASHFQIPSKQLIFFESTVIFREYFASKFSLNFDAAQAYITNYSNLVTISMQKKMYYEARKYASYLPYNSFSFILKKIVCSNKLLFYVASYLNNFLKF
jgi:glycosyltransferase involved in cell wall biosynthesis